MIYSLVLGKDCETTTSSSSSQPYSCPGHNHEDNGEQEQVHLLKSITAETELGCCRNVKSDHEAQGTTIKLSSSDHMISLNPFIPIHDDPSCRNSGRVCVDCNTTKTPLWRSGPQGPKSLCNACGIRYRKARRALAAIAAGDDHPSKFQASHKPNLKRSKLQQHVDPTLASKKRSKLAASGYSHCSSKKKGSHQLCFHIENLQVGSDHDAKEAAVLLMALSCGLVHG